MNDKLFVTFLFTLAKGSFEIAKTNMNTNGVHGLVEAYLRSILGAGKDTQEAEDRDVYTITLAVDLSDDTISVRHDCGNLGLVAGILSAIFKGLPEDDDA